MSTRAIISRAILTDDSQYNGEFKGVYHHWDGYPTGLGAKLIELLNDKFKGNLSSMLNWVIDKHPAGWSSLYGNSENKYRPECYCHPKRKRAAELMSYVDQNSDCSQEWIYVFDVQNRLLYVTDVYNKVTVALPLAVGTAIDWTRVECGENLERCKHVAEYHFENIPEASARLSTQTYLGITPLKLQDAVAVIVDGKRYKLTGSGYNAGYRLRNISLGCPDNAWVGSVVASNGRRMDMPTFLMTGAGNCAPYPGVTYIMPPTKDNPAESRLSQVSFEVQSESNSNKTYTVTVTANKTRTCTCPDFKFRKNDCKHIITTRFMGV